MACRNRFGSRLHTRRTVSCGRRSRMLPCDESGCLFSCGKALVLRPCESFDLSLATVPVGIDSRLASFADGVELLLHCTTVNFTRFDKTLPSSSSTHASK